MSEPVAAQDIFYPTVQNFVKAIVKERIVLRCVRAGRSECLFLKLIDLVSKLPNHLSGFTHVSKLAKNAEQIIINFNDKMKRTKLSKLTYSVYNTLTVRNSCSG